MQEYKNLGGDSGIKGYEIGHDWIRVNFRSDDSIYLYSCKSTSKENIEKMQELAQQGEGLNSFINKKVRRGYEQKER